MGMADPTITAIHCVAIPVSDQDRSKQLYESLGFEERFDTDPAPASGGWSWRRGAPTRRSPSSPAATSFRPASTRASGSSPRMLVPPTSELSEFGLEVSELLDWETAPLMFSFRDHDGNRLYVSEQS